jgi:hypothetical protein
LTAFADILIDMQVPQGDCLSRRRTFHGVGRYPGTIQSITAELNPEGTDYALLPDESGVSGTAGQPAAFEIVRAILRQSDKPLTRQEILARWPESQTPPHPDSLWRTLNRGCKTGVLVRSGEGNKADAYRYGLASRSQ